MPKDNLWTENELTVALNLYWQVPYNKISGSSNLEIRQLAALIDRTPASVAYKLMNFTSLDSERRLAGNKGKTRASELDRKIWNRYFNDWENLSYDSLIIKAELTKKYSEELLQIEKEVVGKKGIEKERIVKTRVNQQDFRQRVLAAYNEKCCITQVNVKQLLNASHIIPWSKNEQERLNPQNGLCLNTLHDRAFDKGLITVTTDYKVKVSRIILDNKGHSIQKFITAFNDMPISLPDRFLPKKEFLEWHFINVFVK